MRGRDCWVLGAGMTKFGVRNSFTWRELAAEGAVATLESVDVSPSMLDGIITTSAFPERTANMTHVSTLVAEMIGASPNNLVARVEQLCASGTAGIILGCAAIASGLADLLLVLGVEKLNVPHPDGSREEAFYNLALGSDKDFEAAQGLVPPAFFAMVARSYENEYGLKDEQRALVSEKNHRFGVNNPYAHYDKETPVKKILNSPITADPLRLLECTPVTDGSAGIILASEELGKEYADPQVYLAGCNQATSGMSVSSTSGPIHKWDLLRTASEGAYKTAGITPEEVDVSEVHDCFTISELIETEYLGFCREGEGAKFIEEGKSDMGGEVVINPGGGLLSRGHPFGATGIAQANEIFNQLKGTSHNQVEDANIGLTHTMSGYNASHSVIIFRKR